jgi:hypothetical protein
MWSAAARRSFGCGAGCFVDSAADRLSRPPQTMREAVRIYGQSDLVASRSKIGDSAVRRNEPSPNKFSCSEMTGNNGDRADFNFALQS